MREEIGQILVPLPLQHRLPERRHRRVPDGRRRQTLLHRDEYPHPGRASRHRDDHRHRPREERSCGSPPASVWMQVLPAKLDIRGHAIECRINAEHPAEVHPICGQDHRVQRARWQRRSRRYRAVRRGRRPAVLRLAHRQAHRYGDDRAEAIARMERALSQFVVQGIETSIPLHQAIFAMPTSAPANSTPSSWNASWRPPRPSRRPECRARR